ncbi:RNA-binding S4 domain-containing protein [Dyella sp.]|uniref:RNA-binding S4 domain-containing protein n=1 Tax=Dyella sp. TaxID=1869338 RepID=UPI002ED32C6C
MSIDASTPLHVRADVWLWAARFFKTRSIAKQAIEGGKVEVNQASCKPSRAIHVGDTLNIARGDERFEVEVLGISGQRGPSSAAQKLYRESEASLVARAAMREQRRLQGRAPAPLTRPDKQSRRLLLRLKDQS